MSVQAVENLPAMEAKRLSRVQEILGPAWLTPADVAAHTKLSLSTIRREIYAGRLEARRFGGQLRITPASAKRWMRREFVPVDGGGGDSEQESR